MLNGDSSLSRKVLNSVVPPIFQVGIIKCGNL